MEGPAGSNTGSKVSKEHFSIAKQNFYKLRQFVAKECLDYYVADECGLYTVRLLTVCDREGAVRGVCRKRPPRSEHYFIVPTHVVGTESMFLCSSHRCQLHYEFTEASRGLWSTQQTIVLYLTECMVNRHAQWLYTGFDCEKQSLPPRLSGAPLYPALETSQPSPSPTYLQQLAEHNAHLIEAAVDSDRYALFIDAAGVISSVLCGRPSDTQISALNSAENEDMPVTCVWVEKQDHNVTIKSFGDAEPSVTQARMLSLIKLALQHESMEVDG
eukprot:TRINITY_DN14201_c0_g1_i1.p1 TRINITY_DN14201_c0_g1~~TRINITY_DN14201_c0_g1_i1.p1  ORF type:complete len:289 (-),score=9.82 TRINITY_DN14201_c0_g1_i1:59-874(-)